MPKKVERIEFLNGGERIVADLYRPTGRKPHPCVVMAHGFGATRHAGLVPYAERFRKAGLGVLLFDYRHFGESEGRPRQLLDPKGQVDDWHRAIAEARMTEWIDGERIGLWGTSFSGGHVVRVAAEDGRVKAIVSQCPMTDGFSVIRASNKPGLAKLTAAGLRDQVGVWMGREPVMAPSAASPGETGAMTGPGHLEGYLRLLDEDETGTALNAVCARIALRVGLVTPIFYAKDVVCPALVCICDRDTVTPPGPAAKMAGLIAKGEARHYDCDHFDIYFGEMLERAVTDQAEFLAEHLA